MGSRQPRRPLERALGRVVDVLKPSQVLSVVGVALNERTHRTWALPIVLYSPTSRCNSRCISCEWWRADGSSDLSRDEVAALCRELPALRTKLVIFTGGEPLVRNDVFELADLFLDQKVALHLLTSGLALERHAQAVAGRFRGVTISLDGHTPELYRGVRGVDGLAAVERGVRRLKELRPELPVRARATLHRRNFRALPDLIDKAASMGLDQLSFLAADSSSDAFGRGALRIEPSRNDLLLDEAEVNEFETVIEKALLRHARSFASGKVAERGERLRNLARYYRAHLGQGRFPAVRCNAPWASAVVEADGTVRPCFFQAPVGNLRQKSFRELLQGEMVRFRRGLDVARDGICEHCVCSLRFGVRSRMW